MEIKAITFVDQGTREVLRKHVDEFGDLIRKENEVALIIDGKVRSNVHTCRGCVVKRPYISSTT